MKLTVSISHAQRAAEVIHDSRELRGALEQLHPNVWTPRNGKDAAEVADEVIYAFDAAGIPHDEYDIEN